MIQSRMFEQTTSPFSGLALFEADAVLSQRGSELVENWRNAYPNVNVEDEIKKAHAWQLSNPARRKKSQSRFLNNWIKSASKNSSQSWTQSAKSVADAIGRAMGGD